VPAGLIGTFHQADILGLVVDASTDPLEETETLLDILHQRQFVLRSVPRDQLDASNPHEHCAVIIATKSDLAEPGTVETLRDLYSGRIDMLPPSQRMEVHPVSAETGEGIDQLLARCWQLLAAIRVYTKEPGQNADTHKPFILDQTATIDDLALEIHRDLAQRLKFAKLWRPGHPPGLPVQRTETLRDKDIVELHQ